MATRHAAGRLRPPSAMQLNQDLSVICRLIFVQSALALDAQRRTVVPAHAARSRHCCRSGAGFGSTLRLRVIEKYQGLIRPFQRLGNTYELRSG